ncbi:hypothetical protein HCN44_005797 [Aphidius gifuensis]|uniref:Mitochondrial import inner membrane translocase subunit TIM14 n=1 Tax=Aphidius gifuensis TaxID=684658 RepID=A0A834XY72_APHGI|nr:mitochondrial import inner membrane translocase subunit TIM14-like [Aphidius gifuensis]KAF7993016.1 hypothetical protein HCN44_005797 [Aphidius gifuensis]
MASTAVLAGIGIAAVGFGGRYIARQLPNLSQKANKAFQGLSQLDAASIANNRYYKGGFEQPMTKREASLILSVSPAANKSKINDQFKKLMFANHPDRGGSPFIATKIKEAKDVLEK